MCTWEMRTTSGAAERGGIDGVMAPEVGHPVR